jgi:hypothetical protein
VTAYMRAATAFRAVAVLAVGGTVWLAALDHPVLAGLTAWAAFLAVFLGGRFHTGHLRTIAGHVARTRHALTDKENTTG